MTKEISIVIPLPPKHCSQNVMSRGFYLKAAAIATYRAEAEAAAIEAAQKLRGSRNDLLFTERVACHIEAWQARDKGNDGRARFRDVMNLIGALKAAMDGIVDAKIIFDDDYKHLSVGSVILHGVAESKGKAGITITLVVENTDKLQ